MNPTQLILTCPNLEEAKIITKQLLTQKLIACAKFQSIESNFLWKGNIDTNQEILITMESFEYLFDQIEQEIEKTHSYETFVLTSTKILQINQKALEWLKSSLK